MQQELGDKMLQALKKLYPNMRDDRIQEEYRNARDVVSEILKAYQTLEHTFGSALAGDILVEALNGGAYFVGLGSNVPRSLFAVSHPSVHRDDSRAITKSEAAQLTQDELDYIAAAVRVIAETLKNIFLKFQSRIGTYWNIVGKYFCL